MEQAALAIFALMADLASFREAKTVRLSFEEADLQLAFITLPAVLGHGGGRRWWPLCSPMSCTRQCRLVWDLRAAWRLARPSSTISSGMAPHGRWREDTERLLTLSKVRESDLASECASRSLCPLLRGWWSRLP